MKSSILIIGLAALLCACASEQETENPILTLTTGKVQGALCDSTQTITYKGIPYAQAPIGDLRWKRPQPANRWDTVMIADKFGCISYQPAHTDPDAFYTKEFYWNGDAKMSEDCLYLNVWTPASVFKGKNKKLPVAVWIHGGGYRNGWGNEVTMTGEAWTKRGVILVTFNYRLGLLGFLSHPLLEQESADSISGNYGTYDQAFALQWVKDNIAAFGGDPGNITVFGQSAGAASVKDMVVSPLTKKLVSKAIIQSGGGLGTFIGGMTADDAAQLGKEVMDDANCTTLAQMRSLSVELLDSAVNNYMIKKHRFVLFGPVVDGKLLPKKFDKATYDKEISDIPYMIGSNKNDLGDMTFAIHLFGAVRDSLSTQPVYIYRFDRQLPGDKSGAFHSAELWYTFGTLARSWRPFTKADYKLSEEMIDSWTNFAKYGNPNGKQGASKWLPFSKTSDNIMVFDVKE